MISDQVVVDGDNLVLIDNKSIILSYYRYMCVNLFKHDRKKFKNIHRLKENTL